MEGSHWFNGARRVDFNWPPIYFTHGLQLDVIAPYSILTFSIDVLLDCLSIGKYEVLEEDFSRQYVIHALLPYELMLVLFAVEPT